MTETLTPAISSSGISYMSELNRLIGTAEEMNDICTSASYCTEANIDSSWGGDDADLANDSTQFRCFAPS
jgi:hypothetical protein